MFKQIQAISCHKFHLKTEMITIYYNRRSIRLKDYDYSQNGMYFVTICTHNRKEILSKIERIDGVGAGFVPAFKIILTSIGKMIDMEIQNLENEYPIKIEKYVIMPNHIHFIINICKLKWCGNEKMDNYSRAGTRHAPTIPDIVRDFKSKTTVEYIRYNKKIGEYKKLWRA